MSAQDNVHEFKPRPNYREEIRRISALATEGEREIEIHALKEHFKNMTLEAIRNDVNTLIKTLKEDEKKSNAIRLALAARRSCATMTAISSPTRRTS
jgi:hypothetical protein